MQQRLALRQLHQQEPRPIMPILRTLNGSEIALSPDADYIISSPPEGGSDALTLYNPGKPPCLLVTGSAALLQRTIQRLRLAVANNDERDVVDLREIVARVST